MAHDAVFFLSWTLIVKSTETSTFHGSEWLIVTSFMVKPSAMSVLFACVFILSVQLRKVLLSIKGILSSVRPLGIAPLTNASSKATLRLG